jgi:predicted O-methyltransferase YrrM
MALIRTQQSKAIPYVELEPRHMAHLRVVTGRDEFLRQLPTGGRAAEVGVNVGDLSAMILVINQPDRLHLVDCWSSDRYHGDLETRVRERFAPEIAEQRVQIDLGLSWDVLETFPDGYFDWIYIDTDHGYKVTARELPIAGRKVKAGGIVAGHDYVTGNWDGGVRYGVVEAVNEFCVKNDWELVLLTNETHRHLSFGIRKLARS